MDHKYIDDLELVERYLLGRLAAEESAEFEAHFVDCRECVGHLNTTRALIDGLRVVVSEQAVKREGYERKGPFGSLQRTWPRWSLAVAACVVMLAFVGAVLVSIKFQRSRIESDQARSAAAEWQRRYEEERESSSLADKKNQDLEHDLRTQMAKLRQERETEGNQDAKDVSDEPVALKNPQINLPIFLLASTRSAVSSGTVNELDLTRAENFVILVSLEGETGYVDYRMTIENDRGQVISESHGLKPDTHKLLSVGLNKSSFRNGDYTLTVEGVSTDRNTHVVGKYSLRMLKTARGLRR